MKAFIFVLAALFSFATFAVVTPQTNCQGLTEDLIAMQNAQTQILGSMVNQTKEVSTTLRQFSEKSSAQKIELQNASLAYMKHHDHEEQIVTKFEDQSNALLKRVADCLSDRTNK